jgi:protein tyrosine phosphatase
VHCETGIGRTGYVAIVLEALMRATLRDITKDYMLSFVDAAEYSENDFEQGSFVIESILSKNQGIIGRTR